MPSDANGVYTLPDGYLAVNGETILASQHNPPLEDLGSSMTQRVMRTGATPMTGPFKLADGTVSAPGLAFASAVSTGVYKTTNGVGVAVGGVRVAEFTSGGMAFGGRSIGELFTGTWSVAPAFSVLPFGQTLSRTDYAALWTFAQAEIALGNTFYNNGNGTTTFGIGDMRGRVAAGKDNMGGSAAGRLTATYFGAVTGATGQVIGGGGGSESQAMLQSNMPNVTIGVSGSISVVSTVPNIPFNTVNSGNTGTGGSANGPIFPGSISIGSITSAGTASLTSASLNGGVTQTLMKTATPSIITNYALFAGA